MFTYLFHSLFSASEIVNVDFVVQKKRRKLSIRLHLYTRVVHTRHTMHDTLEARPFYAGAGFFSRIENNKFQCNKTKDSSEFL